MSGVAAIKPEFLRPFPSVKKCGQDGDESAGNQSTKSGASGEAQEPIELGNNAGTDAGDASQDGNNKSAHNNKRTAEEKKKMRGQNKKRPRPQRLNDADRLCPHLQRGEETCPFGENCRYEHDIKRFWDSKLPDIADRCPNYDRFGKCAYGLSCRFARAHVDTVSWKNLEKPTTAATADSNSDSSPTPSGQRIELNTLDKDLQKTLRQRRYDFERSSGIIAECLGQTKTKSSNSEVGDNGGAVSSGNVDQPTAMAAYNSGCGGAFAFENVGGESMTVRAPRLDWNGLLYLAPLTTVGNLPFRRVCVEFGAQVTCGEMAMANDLIEGRFSEWALVKRHESERIFGVQLCGNHVDVMTKCAQLLTDQIDVDFIDVNLGCPIDLVCGRGAGCSLMTRHNRLEQILRCMRRAMPDKVALTVKMRTGYYESKNIAHLLAPKLPDMGVSLFTLHGRSREQRYTKLPNWQYICQCANTASPLPCYGCGDIFSYEDYYQRLDELSQATNTNNANKTEHDDGTTSGGGNNPVGIMIARGALVKPWIFTEIKERRHWDISANERLDILKRYVDYGLEHWGSDQQGVNNTRRFLLEWLSFLHRYIPVGLLERIPQRINERPPYFFGRNDLETLFASGNCADWIKITEMLLGPVPPGFVFLPKHKANSYQ